MVAELSPMTGGYDWCPPSANGRLDLRLVER